MNERREAFQNLPGVDTLLASAETSPLIARYGAELTTFAIRQTLEFFRQEIRNSKPSPTRLEIIKKTEQIAEIYGGRHLKKVINATGVIIHTNLGRAPFSREMLMESFETLQGYSNLEFDLKTGRRGSRNDHASAMITYLTGAEDVLVVNNAAAAVMLVLRAFAKNREVIVSRGELIEIGGSFRIPEIMAASDCTMVEVGTTNKTRLSDYENSISESTALFFKAHKSNYVIKGFTEEVSAHELAMLGKKHHLPVLYDLGSGLLKKINHPALAGEPDVKEALDSGADLVCFSADKLLGGPQAGIIAGKKDLISQLKKEPMLRALRVCKTTLALLETACLYYLDEKELNSKNTIFRTFQRKPEEIHASATRLQEILSKNNIESEVIASEGQCGGGALPDAGIASFAVRINYGKSNKDSSAYAEKMHHQLLQYHQPVLGILRQGSIMFDILTIESSALETLSELIIKAHEEIAGKLR